MTHPARVIANEFIQSGINHDQPLTQLQVLTHVYFANGWTLVRLNRPLVREPFEAWSSGPVIPSLYNGLEYHGRDPIVSPLRTFRLPSFIPDEQEVIDFTYDKYAHLPGEELMRITRRKGTPWHQLRRFPGTPEIPNMLIYDYFKAEQDAEAKRMHR